MLINLLLSAFTYWFNQEESISWIKDEWTKPLWITLICIAAFFLLMIIVLFFRAIIRTRERRIAKEYAEEIAEAERERLRAEKQAEKAEAKERKRAEKEAARARKEAEREDRRREREEKKNRVDDATLSEVGDGDPSVMAVIAAEGPKRELISLTVNTEHVRRNFYVGDEFNHDGLIVNAHFNREPFKEQVSEFSVVAPDMSKVGSPTVVVMYKERESSYVIHLRENPSAVAEERAEAVAAAAPTVAPAPTPVIVAPVVEPVVQPAQPVPQVIYTEQPVVQPQAVVYGTRTLTEISLDLGIVQRVFDKGEEFNCEGLVVYAKYTHKPTLESITDYTLIDEHAFRRLEKLDRVRGVYVIKPHLHTVGVKVVTVGFKDLTIAYTVSVMPPKKVEKDNERIQVIGVPVMQQAPQQQPAQPAPAPQPAPVVEPAKPVREITSLTLDTVVVQRDFEVGEEFNCDGLLVNANYNVAPMMETYASYSVVDFASFNQLMKEDVAGVYVCEPDLSSAGKRVVRVCLNKRLALYIVNVHDKKAEPVKAEEPVKVEPAPQPEPVVVEKVVEKIVEVAPQPAPEPVVVERVIEKVVEVPVEKVVEVPVEKVVEKVVEKPVETVIIAEESVEAGKLRYDKSFEAKFIQSDDDTKHWYTEIKNCLLSYKGCKGRISWKRETFKAKKEVVAKLVFRGNTLCLFVPLNVADYADDKEIEDGSGMPIYEDTPVMIRIKNEKRKRLAITLIEKVMADRQILHGAHQSEDFYLPYEGVVELINRGLIKREIKTIEDEAIFERDKEEE